MAAFTAFFACGSGPARAQGPSRLSLPLLSSADETASFGGRPIAPLYQGGLSAWRLGGSVSLNWRNVGPREPGFETQIQDELYLADLYFAFHGPLLDGVPFMMEFNMPTGAQGTPNLYRIYFQYSRLDNWDFQVGKFLVPFGRYNELYRPDMFLTVTRPLLYASPDSLDLVVRLNSPRPPFSSGYTDVGARASYFPPSEKSYLPSEVTFFVVNGLSEASNRSRTFPTPNNLGIPPPPPNGVSIDFGHDNNNLADNNNNKVPGLRLVYSLGSLNLPWPIPEGRRDLDGVALGFSAMGGQYDLEDQLNFQIYGVDMAFEYQGINVSAEYEYSNTQFRSPLEVAAGSTTLVGSGNILPRDFEEIQGYYVQASFPILKQPPVGKRLVGILVYNQIFRRGPQQDLLLNETVNGTLFPSIAAFSPGAPRISTTISKVTAALNFQMSDHFTAKGEYSYWNLGKSGTIQGSTKDIYQGALSLILGF